MTDNDEQTIAAMATELHRKGTHYMDLVLQPASVFQLVALLQLAQRHPAVTGAMRETSDTFLAGARAYFADCPTVLAVIRRGDDPAEDR